MGLVKDIFRGESNIDFRSKWRVSLIISGVLVTFAFSLLFFKGLNLSIDFEGGAIWKIPAENTDLSVSEIRESSQNLANSRIQEVLNRDGELEEFQVQVGSDQLEQSETIRAGLAELAGISSDEIAEDTIGPTWGDQITSSAFKALIIFFIAVAGYLAWTLEWKMAVAALLAVVHDLIITAGVYSLIGFEVSPATVIALLTILGYSLYDTVVVFDKIKENEENPLVNLASYGQMVSHSMNQVLMRSINTTITTVLPVLSMLIIGAFFLKAESLSGFALALFIGLILGTYSSIFLASPVLVWLQGIDKTAKKEAEVEAKREKRKVTSPIKNDEPEQDPTQVGTIKARARKKHKR